ncbi:3-hydroxybutyryl-CoA dehydrogenase [Rhodobium orientis]|uniref:3-hydroxyacyl-CoA dehydrogenase n=1 Tax=Rhodobium orientis TaxID=34017 RepID=A0A327JNF6_9HYPH|nr:3-hydroxyacyl-CoA dehydrogenase NAD-binding domain-containing protein [Rhodobium orientis]MBB4301290.1 3-hydroxybutyryl-CoA dehydrogenase [Rhodobium orientis]MBK5951120.1 3-hydroxyacyl-CoA dehydrogenase [Rhodobium orientis]RAI26874.1 3-hydroxyacyl-CoA dehydrogenase [Rhodobium orientis]
MTEKLTTAVIGAGLMGHGIAWILADAGHAVRVYDRSEDALQSLPDRLAAIADLFGTDETIAARVTAVTSLAEAAAGADLVVEAAAENVGLKQALFVELERAAPDDAILASNTSSIPIRIIADRVARKQRVVGTHFWNPPHLVPLVEVVQIGPENGAAVERTMDILRAAGRSPVHVKKDVPGFIGNRLQHALKREAIALVASGVCDAETLDEVVRLGFGRRMAVLGPMEQSDLVGLDLTEAIHETIMPALDTTPEPHPYLRALVAKGRLGMKTGEGFRKWPPGEADAVRGRLRDFLAAQAQIERKGKG